MFPIVFISDVLMKEWAERNLSSFEDRKYGPFTLRLVHNRGAFMNMGERAPRKVAALSVLFALLAGFMYLREVAGGRRGLMRTSLSLILGGGLSNTYDRLKREYVVDYVKFGNTNYYYNIGDVAIFLAALAIIAESAAK